jgi:tetratricopeptide (TPR) repeat protein
MSATATLAGNSRQALYAADMVAENASKQLMKEPGWGTLQHYHSIPFYVYVKFAKWDEILEMANKVEDLDYPSAMFHYARGMAFAAKGDLTKAEEELYKLYVLSEKITLKDVTIWEINSVFELVQIAKLVLEAKIAANKKDFDTSKKLLTAAIGIEDALNYNEPPDWFFSIRHELGHVLLEEGSAEQAIKIYLEDLEHHQKNGWALNGLADAYEAIGDQNKSEEVRRQFEDAWSIADVDLTNSVVAK